MEVERSLSTPSASDKHEGRMEWGLLCRKDFEQGHLCRGYYLLRKSKEIGGNPCAGST